MSTPSPKPTFATLNVATNDFFTNTGLTEDSAINVTVKLDVMANDAGTGKTLWSVDNGDAKNDLLTQDSVNGGCDYSLHGAKISITSDGKVAYTVTSALRSFYQSLNAGEVGHDTFTYAIKTSDGKLSWATADVSILGVNDAASISGNGTGTTNEDAVAPITGSVTVCDVDNGQAHTAVVTNGHSSLGTWSVDANGQWKYWVNNAAAQHLNAGDSVTDSFTIDSLDGTAHKTITVTIQGANDAATITGDVTGKTNEDSTTPVTGVLVVHDVDDGQAHLELDTDTTSTYGDHHGGDDGHDGHDGHGDDGHGGSCDSHGGDSHGGDSHGGDSHGSDGHGGDGHGGDGHGDDGHGGSCGTGGNDNPDNEPSQITLPGSNGLGVFTIGLDGHWTYVLNNAAVQHLPAGATTTDSVTVTSEDGTASQVITVTICGRNDGAVITGNASGELTEDTVTPVTGQLFVTDVDDGEAHFIADSGSTPYGSWSVDTTGKWSYTVNNAAVQYLNAGQTLPDSFTVHSADGTAQIVHIIIDGLNDGGVGVSVSGPLSSHVTEDNAPYSINLLANASGGGGALHVANLSANGAGVVQSGDSLNVTPNTYNSLAVGEQATITVSYDVTDGVGAPVHTTATVIIDGVNDAPSAGPSQTVNTNEDAAPTTLNLLLGATDPDTHDVLHINNVHGLLPGVTVSGDSLVIDPSASNGLAAGQHASTVVTYDVVDGHGGVAHATATIDILGINDAATVGNDSKTVTEGNTAAALNTGGLVSVSDPDAGQSFVVPQSNVHGTYGDFSIAADGTWTFTGNGAHDELSPNDHVQDSFTVTSLDGTATGTVTIHIDGSEDAPTVGAPLSATATEDDAPFHINLLTGAQDVDNGDVLHVAHPVVTGGGATVAGDSLLVDPSFYNSLGAGQSADIVVGYDVVDLFGGSVHQTATIHITGANDAATVGDDSRTVTEGNTAAALNTGGQVSVVDPDAGQSFVVPQSNVHGTYGDFSIAADGTWTFTGNGAHDELSPNDHVQDSFTVTSLDGTATGTVTIHIDGSEDAPTVGAPLSATATEDDAPFHINLLTGAQDVDNGDVLHVAHPVVTGGGATVVGDSLNVDPSFYNSLGAGQSADIVVGYDVADSFGGSVHQTATIHVTGVNDPAFLSSDVKFVTEGNTAAALNTNGAVTVIDPDAGESHTVPQSGVAGTYGTFSIDANGTWSYVGNGAHDELSPLDFVADSFPIASLDGTAHGSVTINIHGSNDAPTVGAPLSATATEDDAPFHVNLLTGAQDVDNGDVLHVAHPVVTGGGATVSGNDLLVDPAFYNSLGAGQSADIVVGYDVADLFGGSVHQTATIHITGVNDTANFGSAAGGAAVTVHEGNLASDLDTSGVLTVVDPDAGQSQVVPQSNVHGTYGDFSIDANGNWTFTGNAAHDELDAGQLVQDQFTVTSLDHTASTTVTVNIIGTNDPAQITGTSTGSTGEDAVAPVTGTLVVTDPDAGEAHSVAQSGVVTAHGTFDVDTNGHWSFSVNNASVQSLNTGGSVTDSFTVASQDGTASQLVSVTITGSNDAAVIGGTATGSVTEATASNAGTPTATGTLTDSDVDNTPNTFQPVGTATASAGGYGSFTLTAGGVWTYTLDNSNPTVNALLTGQTLADSFVVQSQDGTAQTVNVTINGATDATIGFKINPTVTDPLIEGVTAGLILNLGTFVVLDRDAAGTPTWSEATAGLTVNATTGVLTVDTHPDALTDYGNLVVSAADAGIGAVTGSYHVVIGSSSGDTGSSLTLSDSGNHIIDGVAGADGINGGGGVDYLLGGTGADTISAGAGSNVLLGGAGGDSLSGGSDADLFLYGTVADSFVTNSQSTGRDSISGFSTTNDTIGYASGLGLTTVQGAISVGGILAAHSVAWLTNGANTIVIANTGATNQTIGGAGVNFGFGSGLTSEISLLGVSSGLTAANFNLNY